MCTINLDFLPVTFYISFEKPVNTFHTDDIFVLRSVLGYNLKSISCIAHQKECPSCVYNQTCAYAFIFETIIPKDNAIQPGTNRASHPFILSDFTGKSFTITLLGDAVKYLPYIYAAFHKAGEKGLFKERIPFNIEDIRIGEESLLIDENTLKRNITSFIWKYEHSADSKQRKEIFIELKTPLRFKTRGHYTKDFTAVDFMQCLFRRLRTVTTMYGHCSQFPTYKNEEIEFEITEKNLKWIDETHYSARQKSAMELGGVCGSFKLKGLFSDFDMALIDFAKKFNAGKNPNFGLGQIDYWERNI